MRHEHRILLARVLIRGDHRLMNRADDLLEVERHDAAVALLDLRDDLAIALRLFRFLGFHDRSDGFRSLLHGGFGGFRHTRADYGLIISRREGARSPEAILTVIVLRLARRIQWKTYWETLEG